VGFEAIARELQQVTRKKADLLRGFVAKGAAGCPICGKELEDEYRSALRRSHIALHERGCRGLLFQSQDYARLRRGIEQLPDA
jgi:hypothetical protein